MTTRSLHSFLQHLRRSIRQPGEAALTDAQLLERWAAFHDQAAFELLLWRHGPMILNTCRRLLRRGEDIEDAFQATFLVLVRKAGSIRQRESLAAWLHRVACRIALRARASSARRAGREQPLMDVPIAADGEEAAARDLRAMVDEEIDRLPARYRRALILCCLQGKSQEEASRLLACPRGTVSSWLTRGRERLRQRLLRRGVVLSVAGMTAALAPDGSAGGLAPLVSLLLRGASTGGVVSVDMMSSQTIALAEGMLRTMLMTKVKIAAAVLLVGALFAAGIGTLSHSTQAADPPAEPSEPKKATKDFSPQWFYGWKIVENDGIAWGKAAHGLQAGIAFRPGDQESYTVGESVTFVIYLRNVSKKEIRLSHIEPLFAEFMPAVEDGDGKRIGVAAGPVNLGRVSIIHRTLEPGERITLGYPWFRIRPEGWRGEVFGPTCCAAPGRYKISYAGLPLRLNDDKVDVSGPGTGQVHLDIQRSDAPKDNQPTNFRMNSTIERQFEAIEQPIYEKEPAFEAQGISGRADEATGSMSFLRKRDFEVPFRIDPHIRSSVRKVTLLASRDRGATFSEIGHALPDDRGFHVRVPRDGVYHFLVQTEDEKGRLTPRDPARVRPSLTICVDTTPPVVELWADRPRKDTIRVHWKASDENLDLSNLRLLYRLREEEAWTKLPLKKAPTGQYDWVSPPEGYLFMSLRVCDKAGNDSSATVDIRPEKRP